VLQTVYIENTNTAKPSNRRKCAFICEVKEKLPTGIPGEKQGKE